MPVNAQFLRRKAESKPDKLRQVQYRHVELLAHILLDNPRASRRLQERLHLWPRIRRKILERRPIRVLHPIEDRGLDRISLLNASPPICDPGFPLPHGGELEQLKTQDVRNNGAVGIRERIAGEIGAAPEVVRHPRNQLLMLTERVDDELRVEAMLDHAALVLGASLERGLIDLGEPLLARHFQKPRTERGGKSDDRAGIVHVLVNKL